MNNFVAPGSLAMLYLRYFCGTRVPRLYRRQYYSRLFYSRSRKHANPCHASLIIFIMETGCLFGIQYNFCVSVDPCINALSSVFAEDDLYSWESLKPGMQQLSSVCLQKFYCWPTLYVGRSCEGGSSGARGRRNDFFRRGEQNHTVSSGHERRRLR